MKHYVRIFQLLKDHFGLFIFSVIMMAFATVFEVAQIGLVVPMIDIIFNQKEIVLPYENVPGFLDALVDWVNAMDPKDLFKLFPIVLIVGMLFKQLTTIIYKYTVFDVSQRISRDIRQNIFSKMQHLSLDFFDQNRTGELSSRIIHDVSLLEYAASSGVMDFFKEGLSLIMFLLAAFLFFPQGTFVLIALIVFLAWPLRVIGKRLRRLSHGTQEKIADINSRTLETLDGVSLVKSSSAEKYEIDRFQKNNFRYYKLKLKTMAKQILVSPMTEAVGLLCTVIIYYWVGGQVFNGEISLGIFVGFLSALISVIKPLKKLGSTHALLSQASAALDRIDMILDAEAAVKENKNPVHLKELENEIEFSNVNFAYTSETNQILKNVNLKIRKGEFVAIVGPTGSGKSTLVKLLPRFYDPQNGSVLIDGRDIRDVSFQSLRKQISIVSQEAVLFNDTIKENLIYGRWENVSDDEIQTAAKQAYAAQFIEKLPRGYDSVVGDRGTRLSGGEKQRISIARAILKNSPVLILDEATSHLDNESEKFVQEALDQLMQGRTVIAIAHRLSTIRKADRIVVLNEGQIESVGTHDELYEKSPLYKKLYELQFR